MTRGPDNIIPMTNRVAVERGTGAIFDIEVPATRGRKRKGKRRMFALVDLESMNLLKLSSMEWDVLHRIMAATNAETNEARIKVREIAHATQRPEQSVSRTIGVLKERKIIFSSGAGVYRVNSWLVFRGSIQDWEMATDMEPEPTWA